MVLFVKIRSHICSGLISQVDSLKYNEDEFAGAIHVGPRDNSSPLILAQGEKNPFIMHQLQS